MKGLSNRWQAIVLAISAFFLALGTAGAVLPEFIPEEYKMPFAMFFWICAIVGFALKELAGGKAPPT